MGAGPALKDSAEETVIRAGAVSFGPSWLLWSWVGGPRRTSLEPRAAQGAPELTAGVVGAAFPKGTLAVRIREVLGPLFEDGEFAGALSARGRPAVSPGALALVSVLRYAEGLTGRPLTGCGPGWTESFCSAWSWMIPGSIPLF